MNNSQRRQVAARVFALWIAALAPFAHIAPSFAASPPPVPKPDVAPAAAESSAAASAAAEGVASMKREERLWATQREGGTSDEHSRGASTSRKWKGPTLPQIALLVALIALVLAMLRLSPRQ